MHRCNGIVFVRICDKQGKVPLSPQVKWPSNLTTQQVVSADDKQFYTNTRCNNSIVHLLVPGGQSGTLNTSTKLCEHSSDYEQHIVRGSKKPRMKSKLYIFNSFGMLGMYVEIRIDY